MAGQARTHPHAPAARAAAAPLRWWTLALPATAFALLLVTVAGTRHSGPGAMPPVVELLGHIRALLPAALLPSA